MSDRAVKEPECKPRSSLSLDVVTRLLHLGLAVFGVWAWLIGSGIIGAGAGDYDHPDHSWFIQHRWVGVTFTVILLARILWGFVGPHSVRFKGWVPWTRARMTLVVEDVCDLLHGRVPDREVHMGLAGLVEALGLLVFLWCGLSGLCNAFAITPGIKLVGWPRAIKHWHELGDILVPAYLGLHVGATVVHSLAGKPVWRKVLPPLPHQALRRFHR